MRMQRRLAAVFLPCFLVLATVLACTAASSTGSQMAKASRLPGDVRAAMVRGDWKEARRLLDERLAAAPEQGDLWLFLKALAFQYDGASEEALATLAEFERRFPASAFVVKARFQRAELQRATGRMAEAAETWEREARRLRSEERQGELAKIYLDLADALSTPPTAPTAETPRIDYAAAHGLYAAVLELEAPAMDRARALLRMTLCRERQEEWPACEAESERFLAAFDAGHPAAATGPFAGLEDVLDVRLRRTRAELRQDNRAQARRGLENAADDVKEARAGRGPYAAAFQALDEAARARVQSLEGDARLAIADAFREKDVREAALAVAALRRFLGSAPGHPRAASALRKIAALEARHGRTEQALAALDELQALAPPAAEPSEARDEDAKLRMQAVMEKGKLLLGQKRFDAAAVVFEDYAKRFPSGPDWSNAQTALVECDFQRALDHQKRERFPEARAAWSAFLVEHPLDARAPEVARQIGACFADEAQSVIELGKRPGATDDGKARAQALLQSAVEEWRRLAQRFPSSEAASQALLAIGQTLEQRLGALEGAVAAYRQCSFGSGAAGAAERLRAMTRPSLALATQGVWRQGGKPRVTAQVRNLEKLRVQTYRLDLATYFQKHRTYLGVEELDLDLIAADTTSELEVASFARYAPLEQTIELPFDGPGTWVVAVTGGDIRATTLVIASQLDVIVKSSLREVFAFAQDVARGEPAEKARVFVALQGANGPRTVELTTGPDGIARAALDEPCAPGPVSVFAERAGHVAAIGLELEGLRLADPIVPTAAVYTDRPAYRSGQTVHWRAIVREVEAGRVVVPSGLPYRVEALDGAGRSIDSRELVSSSYGTLNGDLQLDPAAPAGRYSISVRSPKGGVFQGSFVVEAFATQKVDVELAFARAVVQRGETIELDLKAEFYYGEPVADAPLRVDLPDGTRLELRTDTKGTAHVSFPTRDLALEGELRFAATLLEEGVARSGSVRLAASEYAATLRVPRDVVLAGDRFEAEVETRDAEGAPLGRAMTFTVLRRESSPLGTWSEIEIARLDLTTDTKTGRGRAPVMLERGGHYVLRAEALDRFGDPVTAQASVFASGDEDDVRLRLIAADGEVEVGGVARAQVVNRAGAGLALLTLEADGVLEHRLLRLPVGTSDVELPLDDRAFPRVWIAIARMTGDRFHEHSAGLDVVRRLDVTVEPLEPVYAPSGRAKLAVTAKDQLGRPVAAELSIAVVDEALYDLYEDLAPKLATVFARGARHALGVRTASSSDFAYTGAITKIAEEVLAEERAKQEEAQWDARREQVALGLKDLVAGDPGAAPAAKPGHAADAEKEGETPGAFGGRKLGTTKKGRAGGPAAGGRGAAPRDALDDSETAFWTAALVTGADGRGTVEFELPERSTRWRVTARGVGPGTLVGEATAGFRTRSELFLELRAPQHLVEGDRPRIVARVHDSTGAKGALALKLRVAAGERTTTLPATIELAGSGVVEHVFELLEPLPACDVVELRLEGTGTLGGKERALTTDARVPLRPWGVHGADSESGALGSSTTFFLELDADRAWKSRSIEVHLGPSLQRLLVSEALGEGELLALRAGCLPANTVADGAAHLYGLARVLALQSSAAGGVVDRARLEARARARITELVSAQREDGAWNRARGAETDAHVETTCLAVAALARAHASALQVPADVLQKGVSHLTKAFRSASHRDDELEALIVWALAVAENDDFAAANRLHRARTSVSPATLAYTALALVEMERAPMAAEVAETLATKLAAGVPAAKTAGNGPWNTAPVEMTALAIYALGRALPASPRLTQLVDELLAARPWAPARARGFALAALAWHAKDTQPAQDRSTVEVRVEGHAARTVVLAPDAAGASLEFALVDGAPKKVKVELALSGGGRPHFAAVLRGFSSDASPQWRAGLAVAESSFLAVPPIHRGRPVPTGFGVVRYDGKTPTWNNEVAHLPLGALTRCYLPVNVNTRERTNASDHEYLVLEVPLPAGTRVLEGSVQGAAGGWRVEDGRLIADLGRGASSVRYIDFILIGTLPGRYRVPPPVVRDAHDPARWASGTGRDLEVLARGEPSTDEYRPTPDELFHLGKACFASGERDRARLLLESLHEQFGALLTDEPMRETAEMLLYLSIERRDARAIVRHFEVLREKHPDLTISFERILAVGAAYRELDEHERALLIYKAIVDETFGKDLKVIGALDAAKDTHAALRTFARLLRDHPDHPGTLEAELALCDRLLAAAPKAADDASLRKAGRDRAALTLEGVQRLQRFLSMHPRDPLAAEAGSNLVSAYLAIEDHERTAELGRELARVYTEPKYADAFLYAAAVAEWYRGRDRDAEELLGRIAASTWKDANGVEQRSPNRDLALYILAQIHHARQEYGSAAGYYQQVEALFADARETLLALRDKSLTLPEVTSARPGEKVELALGHRNVANAELLVYPVDLMTLYLREKTLANVAGIELAGISPTLRKTVELPRDTQLRAREAKVELALKEPGAYLVIARGEERHATGLVLVSDLELEVREDATAGRLRIQVQRRSDASFVRGADVKVVGSASRSIVGGKTDPRGLFQAEGVAGTSTVIARLGEREYAFFRGRMVLGPKPEQRQQGQRAGQQLDQQSYYKNVIDQNAASQSERANWLQEEMRKERKGVQVKQVK